MKALQHLVEDARRGYWDAERQAALGKIVLLVEGEDDRDFLGAILSAKKRTWETGARIVACGGRGEVLAHLSSTFPGAFALVDRDTWDDAEVAGRKRASPSLFVTEGWCIENLLLDPAWLQAVDTNVARAVEAQREKWVRSGALWWALQRTREAQQLWNDSFGWNYGAVRSDLDLSSRDALAKSLHSKIPAALIAEARFDVDSVADLFESRRTFVESLGVAEQWRVGVHGKRAFKELLLQECQSRLGGRENWRMALAARLDRPPPLDELIALLLA